MRERDALEVELAEIRKEIDSEKSYLNELKKSTDNFAVIRQEMAAGGISGPDGSSVIQVFKEFGYSTSRILEASAKVMELKDISEKIKQQKQEIDEQTDNNRHLETMLGTLGLGIDQLKSAITSLMTLEQMGVSLDQIVHLGQLLISHIIINYHYQSILIDI